MARRSVRSHISNSVTPTSPTPDPPAVSSLSSAVRRTPPTSRPLHASLVVRITSFLSPLAFFSLLLLFVAHIISHPPPPNEPPSFSPQPASLTPPTLHQLLADVADALDAHAVPFWLMPNLGLLPATPNAPHNPHGRLPPWREGVDLAVNQSHIMDIIQAQARLQRHGILCVESYFGLRLFPQSGHSDPRNDFNTPFVDLVYFRQREDPSRHVVNFCCDCESVVLGPCSKKMCGCLVCVADIKDIFPLRFVRVEGMRRVLPATQNTYGLMLPSDLPGIHPALVNQPTAPPDVVR